MNLLVFSWMREYTLKDIIEAFKELNYNFSIINFDVRNKNKSDCPELYDFIKKEIKKDNYSALFSVNYFPDLARACNDTGLLYISWSYDCPLDIVDVHKTIGLSTNRAFFFDYEQYREYSSISSKSVFHFPLAVNSKRLAKVSYNSKFASDISFVGSAYHSSLPTIERFLDDYYIGYLNGIIEAQKNTYGVYLAKEVLSEDFMLKFNENLKKHDCIFTQNDSSVSLLQLAYSLATEATFENRLLILGVLSNKFNLRWYTNSDSETLSSIKKYPPVDYDTEMPQVFKSSKINLHIGLHAIPSGISLRQLDIMGCGGFLLSSFQPELFDYFTPGEDFDYYSNFEEAYEKCSFYLSNDSIREKVAKSGQEKVMQLFDYKTAVSKITELAFS